jgi:hypothetical protein
LVPRPITGTSPAYHRPTFGRPPAPTGP